MTSTLIGHGVGCCGGSGCSGGSGSRARGGSGGAGGGIGRAAGGGIVRGAGGAGCCRPEVGRLSRYAFVDVVRTEAIMPVGDLDRSLVREPVVAVRYPLWIVGMAGGAPIMIVRRWVVIGFPGRIGILTVGSRGRREARSLTAALIRAIVKGAVAGDSAGGSALAQHWLNSASNLGSRSMSSWPDILVATESEQAFRCVVGSVVGGV